MLTTLADEAEAFGVVEFKLPVPAGMAPRNAATMVFDGRIPAAGAIDGAYVRFRFSPWDARLWPYAIESDVPALQGLKGEFTAVLAPSARTARLDPAHPNWWTADPDPAAAEGTHRGAGTVSQWRVEFLRDVAARLEHCRAR